MTYEGIVQMLESLNLPVAYNHFAEGESPNPPFILYLNPNNIPFYADDKVYSQAQALDIEVYTDQKDPDLEERVEALLTENDLCFAKNETWINSEKLYEVVYSIDVDIDE